MTLNDFLKRVTEKDKDKMLIWTDGNGWANLGIEITDTQIKLLPDISRPFSDEK